MISDYFFVIGKNSDLSQNEELINRVSKKISENDKKLYIYHLNNGFGIQTDACLNSNNRNKFYFKEKNSYIFSNSRIDNIDKLRIKHPELNELSNSEIIYSLYEKYGDDVYELIEGPFSFLIFSSVNKCVVGGRDLFGQRPMYYINTDDYFAISSNVNTLLELDISRAINHNKVLQFILNEHQKDGESFYKNIKKVNGGNFFKYTKNELSVREYLQPKNLILDPVKSKKVILKNLEKHF